MKLLSSESITYGHPDRLCDTIGNAILEEYLKGDSESHVGLEALATKENLVLSGEVKSKAKVSPEKVALEAIRAVGYCANSGFCPDTLKITNLIAAQSPDINQGVARENGEIGAGDQGIITGYATNETPLGLNVPTMVANLLTFAYQEYQKRNLTLYFPDAKSQVTYDPQAKVITDVVMAVSHAENLALEEIRETITSEVIDPVLQVARYYIPELTYDDVNIIINGTGKFTIYGPQSDCGVIGRKLAVDSYGGYAPLGGGNTNAKDPTKVDASAARAARHLALNLVFSGVCDTALVKLSYCIGHAKPISVALDLTVDGSPVSRKLQQAVEAWVEENYSFAVADMISNLDLTKQKYSQVTRTGQFGLVGVKVFNHFTDDNLQVPSWEQINLVPYLSLIASSYR